MRFGLKIAILQSGKSQRGIAADTGIPESRLSGIVRGWLEPSVSERALLNATLGLRETDFASDSPSLPRSTSGIEQPSRG
jgi:hypothetical protein